MMHTTPTTVALRSREIDRSMLAQRTHTRHLKFELSPSLKRVSVGDSTKVAQLQNGPGVTFVSRILKASNNNCLTWGSKGKSVVRGDGADN